MGITDFKEQFVFYASYHTEPRNKLIHVFCVWPILWTALVLFEYIPFSVSLPHSVKKEHDHDFLGHFGSYLLPFNVTFFFALFYFVCYALFERRLASIIASAMIVFSLITARQFANVGGAWIGFAPWKFALFLHIACWICQFYGHGVYEGRAPALLDNLVQAILMAPFFVLIEVMFFFGYRQELQNVLWQEVDVAKAKLDQEKKKKI